MPGLPNGGPWLKPLLLKLRRGIACLGSADCRDAGARSAVVFERFVEIQHEVAGNSEELADALVPQLVQKEPV